MNIHQMKRFIATLATLFIVLFSGLSQAQQFVTDDYFVMPYKSSNVVFTAGENNAAVLPSYGLFPKWEIFLGASLIWEDDDRQAGDHFSTIFIAKNNLWENDSKTDGVSWTFGSGLNPEYYDRNLRIESFRDVYALVDWTIPLADNKFQLDVNPGVSAKTGDAFDGTAWDFTYAARIAWNKAIGSWSPIAEVFGSEGDVGTDIQYKAGFRWEPNDNFRFAITYGDSFDGSGGSGLELGIILVTLPCGKGCSPF